MKMLFLIVLFFINATCSFGQGGNKQKTQLLCQEKWKTLEIKEDMEGEVLFYDQPDFLCGRLSNASIALIKTQRNDTIRVLGLCEIKSPKDQNKFKPGDFVTVTSNQIPLSKIDYVPLDPLACTKQYTFFGAIRLLIPPSN